MLTPFSDIMQTWQTIVSFLSMIPAPIGILICLALTFFVVRVLVNLF